MQTATFASAALMEHPSFLKRMKRQLDADAAKAIPMKVFITIMKDMSVSVITIMTLRRCEELRCKKTKNCENPWWVFAVFIF
jgi:hypothetical protein